jgi:hypothetical protein
MNKEKEKQTIEHQGRKYSLVGEVGFARGGGHHFLDMNSETGKPGDILVRFRPVREEYWGVAYVDSYTRNKRFKEFSSEQEAKRFASLKCYCLTSKIFHCKEVG